MRIIRLLRSKTVTRPESNATVEAPAVQLWYVRWTSRHGAFSSDTREEMEAFTSAEEANTFADSLRAAFALLRHTSGVRVAVTTR